ncbi:MAG: hypothetical protein HRU10_15175 [Opitutales bacterium]|nr:hypothetical protein [Opitutales bacterium]
MGLTELKREVDRLADQDQRELLVYLSHQRQLKDPAYLNHLTEMLDDSSEERWVSFESIKKNTPES